MTSTSLSRSLSLLAIVALTCGAACGHVPGSARAPATQASLTSASTPAARPAFRIESAQAPGRCIASRGGTGPTAVVGLAVCDEGNPLLERIAYDGHSLRIGESCISKGGEFTGAGQGGRMQLWSCGPSADPNPMTRIEPLDVTMDGDHIRVTGTQRCLVAEPAATADTPDGARLVLEPCADTAGQKWRVTKKK